MHLHDKKVGTGQFFGCFGCKSKVHGREPVVSFLQEMVATHQLSV